MPIQQLWHILFKWSILPVDLYGAAPYWRKTKPKCDDWRHGNIFLVFRFQYVSPVTVPSSISKRPIVFFWDIAPEHNARTFHRHLAPFNCELSPSCYRILGVSVAIGIKHVLVGEYDCWKEVETAIRMLLAVKRKSYSIFSLKLPFKVQISEPNWEKMQTCAQYPMHRRYKHAYSREALRILNCSLSENNCRTSPILYSDTRDLTLPLLELKHFSTWSYRAIARYQSLPSDFFRALDVSLSV